MKRKLLAIALLAATGVGATALAQSKINGAGRLMLDAYRAEVSARKAPANDTALKTMLVTLNDAKGRDTVESLGAKIYTDLGDILIVGLPLSRAEELAALDEVKTVEFGQKSSIRMDVARTATGIDDIHAGTADGLSGHAFTGKGVNAGLYDSGLDPNHAAFRKADGTSRVKAVYVMHDGGNDEAYETPAAISTFQTEDNTATHGTHVLGIMAGSNDVEGRYAQAGKSGVQNGKIPYYGVAPEADLIIGCGDFYNEDILRGVSAVVEKGKTTGQPTVVNLSLGSNVGPHDPNSATCRTLDRLSNDAIICISAGNEGEHNIAVQKRATSSNLNTFISPANNDNAAVVYNAEFWGAEGNDPFELDLIVYDKTTQKIVDKHTISNLGGRSYTWSASTSSALKSYFAAGSSVSVTSQIDPNTNRYYVSMINQLQATSGAHRFGVNIRCPRGEDVKGYVSAFGGYSADDVEFASESITGYIPGTSDGSINEMATGKRVISVGAYVSRTNSTPFLNGSSYAGNGTRNDIADFSSYGNSADGRSLPVICAPGAQITSAISSWCTAYNTAINSDAVVANSNANERNNAYYPMQGTSMSSPFVAGTVALWLEAWPEMTPEDCQEIMESTAIKDNYVNTTNVLKKRRWGNGKIDPVAGLVEALRRSASIDGVDADITDKNLVINSLGEGNYQVSWVGAKNLAVDVYSITGAHVLSASTQGDTAEITTQGLQNGVYVVNVTTDAGSQSRKLAIR